MTRELNHRGAARISRVANGAAQSYLAELLPDLRLNESSLGLIGEHYVTRVTTVVARCVGNRIAEAIAVSGIASVSRDSIDRS